MAKISKTKVYNPQKAEAYVGKGVLRNGDTLSPIKGSITPVPNGHLIKKDGTSLKKGGKIDAFSKVKKAMKPKKEKMLMDNLTAVMEAVVKAKPSGAKGQYLRSVYVTTTMGPSVKLDLASAMALTAS